MKKLINWEKEKREFKIDLYMFIMLGLSILIYANSKYMDIDKLVLILKYYLAGGIGVGLFYITQKIRYKQQIKKENVYNGKN